MMRIRPFLLSGAIVLGAALALAGTHTTSGTVYNQNGQFKEAIRELLLAIADNPNDAKAHFQIGYSYSQLDSVALAYQHLMKAKELDPRKNAQEIADNIQSNYARHYKMGQVAFSRDDYKTASVEFAKASLADPAQTAAHYNCAVAYARMADEDSTYHDKALVEADKVLALATATDPNYTRALQLSGRQLAALGREEEAPKRFQQLLEDSPSSYELVEEVGNDLLAAGEWKSAAIFLKMAADARAKVGAEDFNVYFNIGVALFNLAHRTGEDPAAADQANALYDESIEYYNKALYVQPDDPKTVFSMMASYMGKKDWAEAAPWGEKYVSVSPADPKGWQYLGRIYTELGEPDKAKDANSRYQEMRAQSSE